MSRPAPALTVQEEVPESSFVSHQPVHGVPPERPSVRTGFVFIVLISLVLLIPCFWHSRIQASDLSSHIYNAWLATLIEANYIEGVSIATQWTNVLFDLMLLYLLKIVGATAAQKIAVSLAVLVFFWGAFAFVAAVSDRRPWYTMPFLAILAYGWVFHMGLFNFYLSTGLCLWAVALCWRGRTPRAYAALPLLILAFTAHALPVVWAAAVLSYVSLFRRIPYRYRFVLTLGLLGLSLVIRQVVSTRVTLLNDSPWTAERITRFLGVDQAWLFGPQYIIILAGLLLVWICWFQHLAEHGRLIRVFSGVPFQLWLLHALGLLLIPDKIIPPGSSAAFAFIPERMTLIIAVTTCALLSKSEPTRSLRTLGFVIAAAFFLFLYFDTRRLNSVEDRVTALVSTLPQNQRVVGPLCLPQSRVNALLHTIARACIGKCYSFGNYEPSSLHFRIRATKPNPIVLHQRSDIESIETGKFKPAPAQLPIYVLRSADNLENLYVTASTAASNETSACAPDGVRHAKD